MSRRRKGGRFEGGSAVGDWRVWAAAGGQSPSGRFHPPLLFPVVRRQYALKLLHRLYGRCSGSGSRGSGECPVPVLRRCPGRSPPSPGLCVAQVLVRGRRRGQQGAAELLAAVRGRRRGAGRRRAGTVNGGDWPEPRAHLAVCRGAAAAAQPGHEPHQEPEVGAGLGLMTLWATPIRGVRCTARSHTDMRQLQPQLQQRPGVPCGSVPRPTHARTRAHETHRPAPCTPELRLLEPSLAPARPHCAAGPFCAKTCSPGARWTPPRCACCWRPPAGRPPTAAPTPRTLSCCARPRVSPPGAGLDSAAPAWAELTSGRRLRMRGCWAGPPTRPAATPTRACTPPAGLAALQALTVQVLQREEGPAAAAAATDEFAPGRRWARAACLIAICMRRRPRRDGAPGDYWRAGHSLGGARGRPVSLAGLTGLAGRAQPAGTNCAGLCQEA